MICNDFLNYVEHTNIHYIARKLCMNLLLLSSYCQVITPNSTKGSGIQYRLSRTECR